MPSERWTGPGASRHGGTLLVCSGGVGRVVAAAPAVRALARLGPVSVLPSPEARPVARLLPDVDEVLPWSLPWADAQPQPVDPATINGLVNRLRAKGYARAGILGARTHSPLPTALALRLAGLAPIAAMCREDAGGLVDVALSWDPSTSDLDEALLVAAALGASPEPEADRPLLRHEPVAASVVRSLTTRERAGRPLVVVQPAALGARGGLDRVGWRALVEALVEDGFLVAGTGPRGDVVDGPDRPAVVDLGERLRAAELLAVLRVATAAVVGDDVTACLADAVGCPVLAVPPLPARPVGGPPDDELRGARLRRCRERVEAIVAARRCRADQSTPEQASSAAAGG